MDNYSPPVFATQAIHNEDGSVTPAGVAARVPAVFTTADQRAARAANFRPRREPLSDCLNLPRLTGKPESMTQILFAPSLESEVRAMRHKLHRMLKRGQWTATEDLMVELRSELFTPGIAQFFSDYRSFVDGTLPRSATVDETILVCDGDDQQDDDPKFAAVRLVSHLDALVNYVLKAMALRNEIDIRFIPQFVTIPNSNRRSTSVVMIRRALLPEDASIQDVVWDTFAELKAGLKITPDEQLAWLKVKKNTAKLRRMATPKCESLGLSHPKSTQINRLRKAIGKQAAKIAPAKEKKQF